LLSKTEGNGPMHDDSSKSLKPSHSMRFCEHKLSSQDMEYEASNKKQ